MAIMNRLKADYVDLIRFIPEATEKTVSKAEPDDQTQQLNSGLSGTEAKEFYESLVASNHGNSGKSGGKTSQKEHNLRKKTSRQFSVNRQSIREKYTGNFIPNDILKYAQHGQLKEIKKLLDKGVPLDTRDRFGWTAVMCAAHEGHADVVGCLLEHGADVDLCDCQGKNAYSLAQNKGHNSVLQVIDQHKLQSSSDRNQCTETGESRQISFFCDVCKSEFTDCSQKVHETSTVHLFNLKLKPKPDQYLIPATNIGYQLMRKKGWDGEKGLGSSGQGQRYPVKTVLKTDRKCLGGEGEKRQKAKITHFGPNDSSSVQKIKNYERRLNVRTLSKKAKLAKDRKDKRWEHNLRLYFNSE